jgi:hypothetical protein
VLTIATFFLSRNTGEVNLTISFRNYVFSKKGKKSSKVCIEFYEAAGCIATGGYLFLPLIGMHGTGVYRIL